MTVKQKQALLFYLGYYVGNIDGSWGTLSKTACKSFQKDFGGIEVDGICGPKTEKALKHAVAYGIDKAADSTDNSTGVKPDSTGVNNNYTGTFWDNIKYFKRNEFKCTCGGRGCNGFPKEPQEKLVKVADRVREHFGNAVIVSSGVRCKLRNSELPGSVSNSRHLQGKAMDFSVSGFSAYSVLRYVQEQPEIRYAYAIDSNHVHMDIE